MRLPPAALTAPALCPRCDTPALTSDRCVQCSLTLRRCGACHGIAGPFDHFCGFCGHELLAGPRRSPAWRLWILVLLVPLALGLAYGLGGGRVGDLAGRLLHPPTVPVTTPVPTPAGPASPASPTPR